MNNLIKLSGNQFISVPVLPGGGEGKDIISGLNIEKIIKIKNQIIKERVYWEENTILEDKCICELWYPRIIPKTSKVERIFWKNDNEVIASTIGSRYETVDNKEKTVYTHLLNTNKLSSAINELEIIIQIINENCVITNGIIDENSVIILKNKNLYKSYDTSMTRVLKILEDISNLEDIVTKKKVEENSGSRIVSIFDISLDIKIILDKIGIKVNKDSIFHETNLRLTDEEYQTFINSVPFLVSMDVVDIFSIDNFDCKNIDLNDRNIGKPENEPIIGVLDTVFLEDVYFSDWVEYHQIIDDNLVSFDDKAHGTKVSSIIVDGPTLNPNLDDGCGNFRVRHFGISTGGATSSFDLLQTIENIVLDNTDIKVWNLSLGSNAPIDDNSISFGASILDKLQSDNDIIFIIAGTNNGNKANDVPLKKIGSPADSINSLVVNSVRLDNTSASYTRVGPVLKYHVKPDIAYFGGDFNEELNTFFVQDIGSYGTSFAAPWITRKVAYLIHKKNLSRELAKGLIINSAYNRTKINNIKNYTQGFGIVPININDILSGNDEEILFCYEGTIDEKTIFSDKFFIPSNNEKYNYDINCTLSYFTSGRRTFGVDYTNENLDFKFGRIKKKDKKEVLRDDIGNKTEELLRRDMQKWNNIKHFDANKKREYTIYENQKWGLTLNATPRNKPKGNYNSINYALIVRLVEKSGVNLYNDFIEEMELLNWTINKIELSNDVITKVEL